MTTFARLLAAGSLALCTSGLAAPGPITLQPFVSGLSSPVEIVHANDFSGRLFVVEQGGRIRVVKSGQLLPAAFLDLTPANGGPVRTGGEQGLLGLAFHPGYAANGRFFVYYTRALAGDAGGNEIVVARYIRSPQNADLADPASGTIVLTVPHPQNSNHNGGKIAFGPDGYLYIGIGDGGGGGDPFGAGQSLMDLRGKILRIDVDSASPYAIPPTNPYALVMAPGVRQEIWALGLRNPWRFSFDRATGDLFIGDVGQNAWEEIDFEPRGSGGGRNYGWSVYEGTHCYNPATNCSLAGHTLPVIEYGHDATGGFSVTGGYRYRGRKVQEIAGYYIYGDYVSGRIWAAAPNASGTWIPTQVGTSSNLSAFGEDENGELYVANLSAGTIARITPVDADGDGLSDTWELAYFGSTTAANANADSDGDGLTNLREYEEGRNPLLKDNDIFGNARLFAMQQYRDFLNREGDPGGVSFWTNQLSSSAQSRSQLVETFFNSAEFQGVISPVARMYFAYFLRIPDYGGLQFWINYYKAGNSLAAISDAFAASAEFRNLYGALGNSQFVTLVYQNVLGRLPDPGGQAFWTGQLNSGAMTRGQVMTAFSESVEYKLAIANEVYVTMMYVGMLRRSPDPGGFSYWVGYKDQGNSGLALIDGFLASAEYRARFLP
jgi:glucose/arabinose dehydrogenase